MNFSHRPAVSLSTMASSFRVRAKALAVLLLVGVQISAFARTQTFYVSPQGNDSWSGRLADANRNKTDGPFATFPAALEAARTARRAASAAQDRDIVLRGGTYELTAPIVLTPEDSGTSAEQPFTIAAYRKEKPVLSGGRRITGWRPAASQPGQPPSSTATASWPMKRNSHHSRAA